MIESPVNKAMAAAAIAALALLACQAAHVALNAAPTPIRGSAPIRVFAEADYAATYETSLAEAIALWNRETRCRLFVRTHQRSDADVIVRFGDRIGTVAGSAIHTRPGQVVYRAPADTRHAFVVAAHELGHLLGLDHDPWPLSIMHPTVPSDFDSILDPDHPGQTIVLVRAGVAATVAALYCKAATPAPAADGDRRGRQDSDSDTADRRPDWRPTPPARGPRARRRAPPRGCPIEPEPGRRAIRPARPRDRRGEKATGAPPVDRDRARDRLAARGLDPDPDVQA